MRTQELLALFRLAEMDDQFTVYLAQRCGPKLAADFNVALPAVKKIIWAATKLGIDIDSPILSDEQNQVLSAAAGSDLKSLLTLSEHLETFTRVAAEVKKENKATKEALLEDINGRMRMLETLAKGPCNRETIECALSQLKELKRQINDL